MCTRACHCAIYHELDMCLPRCGTMRLLIASRQIRNQRQLPSQLQRHLRSQLRSRRVEHVVVGVCFILPHSLYPLCLPSVVLVLLQAMVLRAGALPGVLAGPSQCDGAVHYGGGPLAAQQTVSCFASQLLFGLCCECACWACLKVLFCRQQLPYGRGVRRCLVLRGGGTTSAQM